MHQRLGQHFLKDRGVVKKIIGAIEPKRGEAIVEIGPGHGELTLPLAEACAKVGARLVAIEKDPELVARCTKREALQNAKILQGDARSILPDLCPSLHAPRYKIVGNIPYYMTGNLLRSIGELEQKPARCVFMVQKEVAERIVAAPPRMNRLGAAVQYWAEPRIVAHVKKENFSPKPKVDSAIVRLEARGLEQETADASENYYHALRVLFRQPRKTILNNLKSGVKGKTKDAIAKKLLALDIAPTDRPENLSRDDILRIARAFCLPNP